MIVLHSIQHFLKHYYVKWQVVQTYSKILVVDLPQLSLEAFSTTVVPVDHYFMKLMIFIHNVIKLNSQKSMQAADEKL